MSSLSQPPTGTWSRAIHCDILHGRGDIGVGGGENAQLNDACFLCRALSVLYRVDGVAFLNKSAMCIVFYKTFIFYSYDRHNTVHPSLPTNLTYLSK